MAFYIRGQSLLEMAEDVEAPVGTIKRRLHTARKRLKAVLEEGVADATEWSDGAAGEVDMEDVESPFEMCV